MDDIDKLIESVDTWTYSECTHASTPEIARTRFDEARRELAEAAYERGRADEADFNTDSKRVTQMAALRDVRDALLPMWEHYTRWEEGWGVVEKKFPPSKEKVAALFKKGGQFEIAGEEE